MSYDSRDLPILLRGKDLPYGLPSTEHNLTFSETATNTDAVGSSTYWVRLVANAACRVDFATTPTATTATMRIPANWPEYFMIEPGHKVSVLSDAGTATGSLNVVEFR